MAPRFKLPDGTETDKRLAYLDAWDALAEKLLRRFPGYSVHSYDPGFSLTKWVELPDGKSRSTCSFQLPLTAALALIRATPELDKYHQIPL